MSETLKKTFTTEKNVSNSSSSRNSEFTQIDMLSPIPSCSKNLTNCYLNDGNKHQNLKHEEETQKNTIKLLPKLPNSEKVLDSYSDYEIYDENNNCMLTNLNDFGLTYFNINDDGETIDEYLNKDIYLDSIQRFTENVYNESSKGAKLEEINNVINENINILNLDEVKKQVIDQDTIQNTDQSVFQQNVSNEEREQLDENINIQKYCNECPEWLKLIQDDIEKVLKCNFISKVCTADTVNEIPNDKDSNIDDNKFPETVCKVLNGVEHIIINDNINLVDTESIDCLLVNREISYATINTGKNSDDSDTCSYHSSDFEFIDEEEARKECKLNIEPNDIDKKVAKNNAKDFDNNYMINDYHFVPKSINNTSIPSGDDYHNLFLGKNLPFPCINEHKALSSIKGMEVSAGPITDLKYSLEAEAKYEKEANESIQIILSMYPNENDIVFPHFSK